MTKYLFKRLLHGLVSVVIVVGCVMTMIYSLMDRNLIFAQDATYSHQSNNQKKVYKYQKWETYGYLDYVTSVSYTHLTKKRTALGQFSLPVMYGYEKIFRFVSRRLRRVHRQLQCPVLSDRHGSYLRPQSFWLSLLHIVLK